MFKSTHVLLLFCLLLTACGAQSTTESVPSHTEMTPIERGAILYTRCRSCHTLDEGGRHRVGPNLWGMFGAEAGTKDGFNYSNAMRMSGVVWDDETISAYLENPQTFIKGNRMSFVGLRKPEDRDAIIVYLKSKTGAETSQN